MTELMRQILWITLNFYILEMTPAILRMKLPALDRVG
jgi:hypothetical protein